MMKSGSRTGALAALALCLWLGGTAARADLTLTLSEAGGPSIDINSTAGTATFTGTASVASPVTFLIDNQTVTFTSSGQTQNFTADSVSLNFKADGQATSKFGDYSSTTIGITQIPLVSGGPQLTDSDIDVTAGAAPAGALTIMGGNTFSGMSGPASLSSTLSGSHLGAGSSVAFSSTVDSQTVAAPTLTSAPLYSTNSGDVIVTAGVTTNSLVLSNLSANSSDTITGTTTLDVVPNITTPEPSTMAAALLGLAAVGGYRVRRRRGA